MLPRHRLLLRLHVPGAVRVRNHRGARGGGRADALLSRDCHRHLVWDRVFYKASNQKTFFRVW